jgi:polysaccharide biosynthesis/export protein
MKVKTSRLFSIKESAQRRNTLSILLLGVFFMAVILLSSSCKTHIAYFADLKDTANAPKVIPEANFENPAIQYYDILQVHVQTMTDENITRVFDQSGDAVAKGSAKGNLGYQVDKDGYIELPVFGKLKVVGLTLYETRELIKERATKFYVDPVVKVSFMNFYVTVFGAVMSPGRKVFETEKVSIIDVISMCGDLSLSARRYNILVIREENGHKVSGRLNMNSTKIFQSPFYYLQSGDMVYVEQNQAAARAATADYSSNRYLGYITSGLSIIFSVYAIVTRNK